MKYEITHRTTYTYDDVVSASYGQLHQMPVDIDGQRCLERWVEIDPVPDSFHERTDFFGNRTGVFTIHADHDVLAVTSHSLVDTTDRPIAFDPDDERTLAEVRDRVWASDASPDDRAARAFAIESPMVPALDAITTYAAVSLQPARSFVGAVTELVHRIRSEFAYKPGVTAVDTSLAKVMAERRGVCQDFAHVLLAALRSVGLPAAYVSGYIETAPPPGKARLQGADQTHAWVAVHCGAERWIGVDPTNDQVAGPRYVTTARGRDYADIPPLKGVIYTNAKRNKLKVEVDVIPTAV